MVNALRSRPGLILRSSVGSGTPAPPFTPASISGLSGWYDAADTSAGNIQQTGGLVSQWSDKSGNGNHATQATGANQPTTNSRTMNGLNVIDFDGSNDFLTFPAGLRSSVQANNNTIIIINATDVNKGTDVLIGQSAYIFTMCVFSGTNVEATQNPSFSSSRYTRNFTTSPFSMVARRVGTAMQVFYSGLPGTQSGTAANTTLTDLRLGSDSGGTASHDGLIAELLVYNRDLTNAELNNLHNLYLSPKWGAGLWSNL